MKILLINPQSGIVGLGTRHIAAGLTEAGHEATILFLRGTTDLHRPDGSYRYRYEPALITEIASLVSDFDLVGISVVSNYLDRAEDLSRIVHEAGKPVVWGGVHPTAMPESSLKHADAVVIGEGERAMVRIAEALGSGRGLEPSANIWVRKDGEIIRGETILENTDLDLLLPPDYPPPERALVLAPDGGRIVPMTDDLIEKFLPTYPGPGGGEIKAYSVMTGRGCPYACTYCVNDTYRRAYGRGYLRWRSGRNVLDEILSALDRFPFIRMIHFIDDVLTARKTEDLVRFMDLYKAEVGLPFYALAFPGTLDERKVEALVDAGMVDINMGIQSGSERTLAVYERHTPVSAIIRTAELLEAHRGRINPPIYDIITDNPFEGIEEGIETVRLLSRLPRPFRVLLFSLAFFPGTALYERAKEAGIVRDIYRDSVRRHYYKPSPRYLNLLIELFNYRLFPGGLIRLLASPPLVRILERPIFNPFVSLIRFILSSPRRVSSAARLAAKGTLALARLDIGRIRRYLARRRSIV